MLRILGLILLGLLLVSNFFRIVILCFGVATGKAFVGAQPGYGASYMLGTIAMTAIIAYFFVRLLKKSD